MRVQIRAHSPMAVPFVWKAGRPFSTTDFREVDVLDQDEDPPEITNDVPNHTTGGTRKVTVADPDRMGRISFAMIEKDGRFSTKQTDGVDSTIANASVAAARKEVSRLSSDLTNANIKIGELEAQVEQLRGQLSAAGEKAKAEVAKAEQDEKKDEKKGKKRD